MQNYMMRYNLSILIVAMVDDDALDNSSSNGKNVTVGETCSPDGDDGNDGVSPLLDAG